MSALPQQVGPTTPSMQQTAAGGFTISGLWVSCLFNAFQPIDQYRVETPQGNTVLLDSADITTNLSVADYLSMEAARLEYILTPGHWFQFSANSTFGLKDSPRTRSILVDFGFIQPGTPGPTTTDNRDTSGTVNWSKLVGAVVIVAVIGAAVYFIPRDVFQGAVRKVVPA